MYDANRPFRNIWSISATTGADQVRSVKQYQTEIKKNPKDRSMISALNKERNSNSGQFIRSLVSNISLPLNDNLQRSKDNNNQKSDLIWNVNNSHSIENGICGWLYRNVTLQEGTRSCVLTQESIIDLQYVNNVHKPIFPLQLHLLENHNIYCNVNFTWWDIWASTVYSG